MLLMNKYIKTFVSVPAGTAAVEVVGSETGVDVVSTLVGVVPNNPVVGIENTDEMLGVSAEVEVAVGTVVAVAGEVDSDVAGEVVPAGVVVFVGEAVAGEVVVDGEVVEVVVGEVVVGEVVAGEVVVANVVAKVNVDVGAVGVVGGIVGGIVGGVVVSDAGVIGVGFVGSIEGKAEGDFEDRIGGVKEKPCALGLKVGKEKAGLGDGLGAGTCGFAGTDDTGEPKLKAPPNCELDGGTRDVDLAVVVGGPGSSSSSPSSSLSPSSSSPSSSSSSSS